MSNRVRGRHRRRPTVEDGYMVALSEFDGRRPVSRYQPDDLERMVVADAVQGLDNGPNSAPFLWWHVQAYIRISQVRRVSPDVVFEGVQHQVMAATGRVWP